MWVLGSAWAGEGWPSLADPPAVGGGERDAALVVGIGDYWAVPDVPGAADNARDWYAWLTEARGVPADRVRLLVDAEATREAVLAGAEALRPQDGGAAWVVFVGHGAPARDGHDGLLLGADVQQTASSVEARGIPRSALLAAARASGGPLVVVLDACFSGRDAGGEALLPGLQPLVPAYAVASGPETVLSAGGPDQFAGPLPGLARPAFSYLVLGALQGWGDGDGDGEVTASEAVSYAGAAIRATVTDRTQEPGRTGEDRPLAPAGKRRGPDLGALRLSAPTAGPPRAPERPSFVPGAGIGVDVAVESAWAVALATADRPLASPEHVREAWCDLAGLRRGEHAYAEPATAACDEWTAFTRATDDLVDAFEHDYGELRALLAVPTADDARKAAAAAAVEGRYAGFVPAASMAHRVSRARQRLERGRGARLRPWSSPYPHELRGEPHGVFFWGWDPLLRRFPLSLMMFGAGVERAGVGGMVSISSVQFGPVDLGALEGTSFGDGFSWRFHAGFVPFAVRTSRRHPGEVRGSILNPVVGVGYQGGERTADTTTPYGFDTNLGTKFFDAYAADTVFLSNYVGFRAEARLPFALLGEETRTADPGLQLLGALVFNLAGAAGG